MTTKAKLVMKDELLQALNNAKAEMDEAGNFLIFGASGIVSFLGMGEELLVSEELEYKKDGRLIPVFSALKTAMTVTVIC